MRAFALALALASSSLAAAGSEAADPLKSEACASSLAALEAARGRGAGVEAARQAATRSCLGGSGDARRPSPTAQAPIGVPPPVVEPGSPGPSAPPADPRAPRPERPAFVTSCDLGGCWDSEGRRLNRSGPVLLGPNGVCAGGTSGTVHCP